jgi:hypothetical protein
MENIDIKDYFKISDDHSEVRGFLEVKDDKGRTIFIKENMVTLAGRQYIKDHVYNSLFDITSNNTTKLQSINFGKDGRITTSDMEALQSQVDYLTFNIGSTTQTADDAGVSVYYEINSVNSSDSDCNIKISIALKDISGNIPILREAGLFLYDEVTKKKTMFSRVAFAPLTLKSSNTYTINYYIYF